MSRDEARLDRFQASLDRIEAMLQEILGRVPNGALGWSERTAEQRVIENCQCRSAREAQIRGQQEAAAAWQIPIARRESLLLHVLGDERLLIRELTDRLNNELGYPSPENPSAAVYISHVRSLVRRMLRTGELERAPESFKGKMRYRYSRRRDLDGAIVELERRFQDDPEGVE